MDLDHRERFHRPKAFDKMENLVREMKDTESGGVPVRSQKVFLTSIPDAFAGYDLIEWLIQRLDIEEAESLNLANLLCQYGYIFPVESKNLIVKDDSSLYRFQEPSFWPWRNKPPDNVDYAIYLTKRSLRNKQRHGLEDYEIEALGNLRKNLANKWDLVTSQAEEKLRQVKSMKKPDKTIMDSQEKAYWRVHRPPPGVHGCLEQVPVVRCWNGSKPRKKTIEDFYRQVVLLRTSLYRTRIKVSQALENLIQYVNTYKEFDPLIVAPQPSNPWVGEDTNYWLLTAPLIETPNEKRVRKWALSLEDLLKDPTGVHEFTNYLQKEKSEENILFYLAVLDLKRSSQSQILLKIQEIYDSYVMQGSPQEVNIDNQTMDKVLEGMKIHSRYCFDAALEHVYNLLLKKDCYPRFIRSEYYKCLLNNGAPPSQKKRFFGFGPTKKKAQAVIPQPVMSLASGGVLSKRRGSDRSLSGSAHEISHFTVGTHSVGVQHHHHHHTVHSSSKDPTKVPHSHSQSNLSDIPYRVKKPNKPPGTSTSEDVCPWETVSPPKTPAAKRKSSGRSESSSSELSVGVTELADKVQRSLLTQQHTLDCSKNLHVDIIETPRRASVSVPIIHSSCSGIITETTRRKVSSVEDNSSISLSAASSVFVMNANEKDNNINSSSKPISSISAIDKKCSSSSITKAYSTSSATPIISVSSVMDEMESEQQQQQQQEVAKIPAPTETTTTTISAPDNSHHNIIDPVPSQPERIPSTTPTTNITTTTTTTPISCTSTSSNQEMKKAPLAEPDESPASEQPASEIASREEPNDGGGSTEEDEKTMAKKSDASCGGDGADSAETDTVGGDVGEAKGNDVCPWEDEENCKVDRPFVKTYATLGYL